jgi:type I restriction-modification system DNA methylase subunit/REP element-mobilizing transposase RayT
MPLFQNSVVTKYLQAQSREKVAVQWSVFKSHFLNPVIQENIRQSKEEQYQGEFLIDLFVKVLGYTKNPEPSFNLTTEYKNIKDSKKADGAILLQQGASAPCVAGVIELKGTNTTDLGKIETQAFGYKNNQPDCVYVITSNFEKLRFYIDNAIEHIEFNLFALTEKEFELLWLCLAYENIEKGIAKKIKDESVGQEDEITRQLYKDYSLFKRELHQNLVALNPGYEPLELFKKSQKLLDRFLFLFFAEDRQLLPPNSVRLVLNDWKDLQERDVDIPLYDRFRKYFEYLNTGFKGKRYDVYAYNGGLFKPDAVLDAVKIDSDLLYRHTLKLSEYDFVSEVDVNILGHIFENSLNELDEIKAQLEGKEIDKSKTKRKKDGVFYTPKYITKYIVDNTVGKLCSEKKAGLQINEEDYTTDRRMQLKTKQALVDKLTEYRNWLLQLTICDPACGSGAFLNQALDFLIREHKYIDELQAKLFGDALVLSDIENSILENNLFGVDLNEESVEIARLSLWLRTAQPNRKLNDLNNNIKCGNSLIDDPAVAGDKAFNWQKEFPKVFKEKNKKIWHVTTVMHDTRTSQRMIDFKVRERRPDGEMHVDRSIFLNDEESLKLTEIICDVIIENEFNCLAYNVCGDHVHLIMVCEEEELPEIVRKLKGKSAQKFKEYTGISKDETFHLWAQKFNSKEITGDQQLNSTIQYIQTNREKHELPDINKGLQPLVEKMTCTLEHAFRTEYKGGFDVVIGNPPYVDIKALPNHIVDYFFKTFKTAENRINLYSLFIEKGYELIANRGILSFINPNSMLVNSSYKKLRSILIENLVKIVKLPDNVFADAKVETIIFELQKDFQEDCVKAIIYSNSEIISYINDELQIDFSKTEWEKHPDLNFSIYSTNNEYEILNKMEQNSISLDTVCDFSLGITPYDKYKGHSEELIKERLYHSNIKIDETYKPLITGENITRYFTLSKISEYIRYGEWLGAMREERFFTDPRLLVRQIVSGNPARIYASYTDDALYFTQIGFGIISKNINQINPKFLLTLINSRLINFYHKHKFLDIEKSLFQKILIANCKKFPIKEILIIEQQPFIEKADLMLSLNKELHEVSQKFQRTLLRRLETMGFSPLLDSLPKKLEDWYKLSYAEFIKELGKKKIKLSLSDEAEWEAYFKQEAAKALELKSKIEATDKEIDKMVYELYGLTEEEIGIVEGR